MLSHFDLQILKISLNTSQSVTLEKVKHVRSIIEKNFVNIKPKGIDPQK